MISGLLIRGVFTQREEIYWKKRLIDFALDKNKNGVLQRHALEALSYFKDESIIQKLKSLWNSKDEQIQEEFLRLCESINPNSELSIDYFIKGVKGRSIKAMYAMHKVDSKEGVGYFIDCLLKDISLVDPFIDHLSIFDERDSIIFENIYNNWDEDIRKKLESLIVKIFKSKRVYNYNSSRFVISVAELLKRNDGKYTFKLLDKILKDKVLINNFYYFKDIFARIIEKKEVKSLIEKTSKIDTDKRNILWILQLAGDSNRQDGFSIYEEGRKYLKKEYAEIEKNSKKYKRREKSEDKKLYKLFTYKLGPAPKQYITDVFDFYVNNSERLEPFVNEDDKKRLVDLIENTAFKFLDPSKYKLKIQDKTSDRTTYTTNSAISIFGGALLAAENLKLAVKDKYRKAILNYIPFAYDNHLNAIFSLIDDPKPSEIKSVLKVYKDKKSDLWRFMPSSFITACEKYNLIEGVPILKEFVFQENFRLYERVNALKAIYLINPDEAFFKKVFDKYQNIDDSKDVANEANALLIRKYGDKQSTYWRFEQLKKRAFKFIEARGVHAVSDNEDELHSKEFAEPLFSLTDIKYKKDFNLLVKESILLLRKDEEHYKAYVQYLWEITMKYYDGLKVHGTYDPIISLESFLIKITSKDEFGWFGYEIKKLKRSYMEFIGKPSHISTCIRTYNNLKQRQYYEITSTESLAEEVKSALNTELKNWLESSGKKFVEKERETSLQKIIKIKLESIFHKKGFNITIHREVQLESDKRTDFILFYGFIGPLVVEFKLSDNEHLAGKDLKSKESFKNMEHYMKGYESEKGIFLVINNKKEQGRYKFNSHLVKIKNTYEILDGVEVVGIDVLSDSGQ